MERRLKGTFRLILFLFVVLFALSLFGCTSTEKQAYFKSSTLDYSCKYDSVTGKTRIEWSAYIENGSVYDIKHEYFTFNIYNDGTLVSENEELSYSLDIKHGTNYIYYCNFYFKGEADKIDFVSWEADYESLWHTYIGWWIATIVVAAAAVIIVVLACAFDWDLDDIDLSDIWAWLIPVIVIATSSVGVAGFATGWFANSWIAVLTIVGDLLIIGIAAFIIWMKDEIYMIEPVHIVIGAAALVTIAGIVCGCIFWKWWITLLIAVGIWGIVGIVYLVIEEDFEIEPVHIIIGACILVTIAGIVCGCIFWKWWITLLIAAIAWIVAGIPVLVKYIKENDKMKEVYEKLEIALTDFDSMTLPELKAFCREKGIKGYSKLNKNELIYLIKSNVESSDGDSEDEDTKDNKENKKAINDKNESVIKSKKTGITFDSIAGLENVKEIFKEKVILPFEHPEVFEKYGKKAGGGILLYGLPGTGKTMFAEACSNELNATFISVKCSDIKSKWYGESEQKVKAIFSRAKKSRRAIIFFDEFEAIGAKRTEDGDNANNDLVPEILAEMQGVGSSSCNSAIMIIAATNKPWSIDSAFLRPGRFDEKIYIPLPDYKARKRLFEIQLSKVPVSDDLSFDYLAEITEGFNGADIKEVCEKLKLSAIKDSLSSGKEETIGMDDVEKIKDTIKSSVSLEDVKRLEIFEKENK